MTAIDVSAPLTPSEVVLLHGDEFAAKAGLFNRVKLLHRDEEVSAPQLAQAMLAAALLANEGLGALRLEVRSKKNFLGLGHTTNVYAEPLGPAPAWPQPSLEAELRALAETLRAGERNDVDTLLYTWLAEDDATPWVKVVEQVKAKLAARGLLEVAEKRQLKIFVSRKYALPESTASLAARQPWQPLHQMLSEEARRRPELWKLLEKQIKRAIQQRTEKSENDFDD
jgi:hypothetical protein